MLVARAARAQGDVARLDLDARLARAGYSRRALLDAADAIVDLAVTEARIPRRFARRELTSATRFIDAVPVFAEAIRPRPVPAVSGHTELQWWPFGVVVGWHAANSPIWVPTLVAISALVAGNAVIARPSRRVGATTLRVLDALASAWPADAVVPAPLDPTAAEELIAHPGVHAVVAHASTETCKRHVGVLARAYAAGAPMRPYIPEASGNDAFIVMPGADLPRAAAAAALGGFANSGQLCMAAKRLVVHAEVWPALLPYLREAVEALVVGDPDDEATDIGPVLSGVAAARARQALREALEAGAELVVGGAAGQGDVLYPTLVRVPRQGCASLALWREEMFAPVRSVVLCESAADAVALANDTPYGLGVALFGGTDDDRARIVGGVRAARVVVDEGPLYQDPHLVVGGVGDSGLAGSRPKIEQLVWGRRVHRAAG